MLSGVGSRLAGAASLAGVVLLAAACGGGGSGPAKAADSTTTVAPSSSSAAAQQQQTMGDYLQCLKDHGITVPTDANGNPTFGPRGGNGGGGSTASTGADTSTPPDSSGTPPSSFDRTGFQQARQACGTPPGRGAGGGGGTGAPVDPQAAQQAALQFAACLRAQGLNVADPDFSTTTTTPPTSADSGNGGGFRRGGGAIGAILRNLDQNDPTVQAALQKCQANFPGRSGQGGASTSAPSTTG